MQRLIETPEPVEAAHLRPARPDPFALSVLVPAYNEGEVIDRFLTELIAALEPVAPDIEILCIDDGSADDTLDRLASWHARDPRIKVLALTRNFGKEAALSAAIDHASGDVSVAIDADLQHPPAVIGQMIERWREGSDVVVALRRDSAAEGRRRGLSRALFYRLFNMISEQPIMAEAGDFRLMDRAVIATIRTLPERNRFMKGLFAWVGFKVDTVHYDLQKRAAGESHWPVWRLWNFALDGITAFSTLPLRMWSYVGLGIALISLVYASWIVISTLIWGIDVPGFASLIVLILFLGAVQLISLGVLGEYVGRVLTEVKRRPVYLVRKRWGLDDDDA